MKIGEIGRGKSRLLLFADSGQLKSCLEETAFGRAAFPSPDFACFHRMQSIRPGGPRPPCPKATEVYTRLVSIPCQQQREQRFFVPPSSIRYCGSRDEPSMTACGGNFIGGEIIRNKQSRHEGELRRLKLRTLTALVGVWGG